MPSGSHGLDVVDGDLVVAEHLDLGAELAEVLVQIVGERVVVVDQHDPRPIRVMGTAAGFHRRLMLGPFPGRAAIVASPGRAPAPRRPSPRPRPTPLPGSSRRPRPRQRHEGHPVPKHDAADGDRRLRVRRARRADRPAIRPRLSPSTSAMASMARTLGAPQRVPAGNVERTASNASRPGAQAGRAPPDESASRGRTAPSPYSSGHSTLPASATRPTSLRARSTSIACSASSFSSARRSASSSASRTGSSSVAASRRVAASRPRHHEPGRAAPARHPGWSGRGPGRSRTGRATD